MFDVTYDKQNTMWKFRGDENLNDYTLIITSVAVGNVGQLACDLLISSLAMRKIASVYSPAVIPVVGYNPYDLDSKELSTSCETYKSDSRKVIVLQFRASLVHKYARDFLENVVKTFKEKCIKDIVILTSSFAHENKHISGSPFRFIANEWCPYKMMINTLNWVQHDKDAGTKIHGGGFASLLYEITTANSIPCLILFKYCSEGDNIPDAFEMVYYLARILPIFNKEKDFVEQMAHPVSWKYLFGRPPPKEIY